MKQKYLLQNIHIIYVIASSPSYLLFKKKLLHVRNSLWRHQTTLKTVKLIENGQNF